MATSATATSRKRFQASGSRGPLLIDELIQRTALPRVVSSSSSRKCGRGARYLVAIFNSGPQFKAVEPLMSEGLFGKRDIDKHVLAAPVPFYDSDDIGHFGLARLGERAERVAAAVELSDDWGFQKSRRVVREALAEDGVALEIDAAVAELLAIGLTKAPSRSGKHSTSATDLMDALSKAEGESSMPRTRSILADVDRPQPPDTARRRAAKRSRSEKEREWLDTGEAGTPER